MEKDQQTVIGIFQDAKTHTGHELEQLQKKYDELVKETNQFTYIITHDLQAPLRMVTGFLDLLEKKHADKLDDSAKQFIEYAVRGSEKMKALIFDLLEYSRLNSLKYEFADVDLNDVLNEVKERSAELIKTKNVIIKSGAMPVVWGSRKLLVQIISELIDNAIKFCKNDPCEIVVDTRSTASGWKITVADNGIGIDPAYFERIFVVFKKLHPDDAGYSGTGTGLAICKKIAEMHNGSIEVSSTAGTGSKFMFTINKAV
jgi:light-regulated signal transduction histidine kinase (bacteriophytochrome)